MIVVVCAAFSLTVSEAKTEIMCLRKKGMSESSTIFPVEAEGHVYNPNTRVFILQEERPSQCRPVHRG